jgi:hypothetical protein
MKQELEWTEKIIGFMLIQMKTLLFFSLIKVDEGRL